MTDEMKKALGRLKDQALVLGETIPAPTARALRKRGWVAFKGYFPTRVELTFTGREALKMIEN